MNADAPRKTPPPPAPAKAKIPQPVHDTILSHFEQYVKDKNPLFHQNIKRLANKMKTASKRKLFLLVDGKNHPGAVQIAGVICLIDRDRSTFLELFAA